MRLHQALLSSAVSMTMSIGLAPPAHAQSFFQKLFGFGSAQSAPAANSGFRRQTLPAHRFYNRGPGRLQTNQGEDEEIGPPDSGGPYRIMCVRACDGYYFPMRAEAWRRNFASDARTCRAACQDHGRLFYYPVNGGGVDTMVDLAGEPYTALPHAYGYRKALVSGCTCNPQPWSAEAIARHQQYAVAEAEQNQNQSEPKLEEPAADSDETPPAANSPGINSTADSVPDGQIAASSIGEQTEQTAAAEQITPEQAIPRRRQRLRVQRLIMKNTGYNLSAGFNLFGSSKTRYIRPGDRR